MLQEILMHALFNLSRISTNGPIAFLENALHSIKSSPLHFAVVTTYNKNLIGRMSTKLIVNRCDPTKVKISNL